MKRHLFIAVVLVFASLAGAQISIDTISTDTIDIFKKTDTISTTSSASALLSSLIIPGSGHQMLDRPSRALVHFSTDCIALFGAIVLFNMSHAAFENAKSLAYIHAGVARNASSDDAYWQMIGSFNNYDDYQAAYNIDMRSIDNTYTNERFTWIWDDTLSQSRYVKLQKRSQQLSTFASFCVGAMVLNRLVAIIDIHSTLRNRRFKTFSAVSFSPVVTPTSSGMALSTTF